MKRFEIRGNKITSETLYNVHTFEIVEKIPSNFFVWNIGKNMGSDEYIPICEALHPGDKDDYSINPNTLKAIKLSVEEVEALRSAAGWGITNKRAAEKALNSKRNGYFSNHKKAEAEKVIEIFKKITAYAETLRPGASATIRPGALMRQASKD